MYDDLGSALGGAAEFELDIDDSVGTLSAGHFKHEVYGALAGFVAELCIGAEFAAGHLFAAHGAVLAHIFGADGDAPDHTFVLHDFVAVEAFGSGHDDFAVGDFGSGAGEEVLSVHQWFSFVISRGAPHIPQRLAFRYSTFLMVSPHWGHR